MSNVPSIDRASRLKAIQSEVIRAVGALLIALAVTFIVVLSHLQGAVRRA